MSRNHNWLCTPSALSILSSQKQELGKRVATSFYMHYKNKPVFFSYNSKNKELFPKYVDKIFREVNAFTVTIIGL